MITTLMMLLGLSGAGLYNVIKKPEEGADTGGEPSSSSRRRRGRGKPSDPETAPEMGRDQPSKEFPTPEWGGRGKELPFKTQKSKDNRGPEKEPSKLHDGSKGLQEWSDEEGIETTSKDKAKRKRDKSAKDTEGDGNLNDLAKIPLGDFGSDIEKSPSKKQRNDKPKVTYPADDIISKNSKYSFHRRPLLNAEALVEKNRPEEAIEIMQRTGDRIPDAEIKHQINTNIRDLEKFLEDSEGEESGKFDDSKGSSVNRLDLDYQVLVSAMKQVAEVFAASISKAMQFAQLNKGLPQTDSPYMPPSSGSSDALHPLIYQFFREAPLLPNLPGSDRSKEKASYGGLLKSLNQGLLSPPNAGFPMGPLPPEGAGSGIVGPFYVPSTGQFSPGISAIPETVSRGAEPPNTSFPMGPLPSEGSGSGIVGPFFVPNTGQFSPGTSAIPETVSRASEPPNADIPMSPFPSGGAGSGIVDPFFDPNTGQSSPGTSTIPETVSRGPEPKQNLAAIEAAIEGLKDRDLSEIELPDDAFFSEDWKNFRDLPLVDRRLNDERRINTERRDDKAGRKDRRSDGDRRTLDRFKEREDYLKDKALEKLETSREQARAEQQPPASLNDLLKPYFPPVTKRERAPISPPSLDDLLKPYSPPVTEKEREPILPDNREELLLPDPLSYTKGEDKKEETFEEKEKEWIEDDSEWFDKTSDALRKKFSLPEAVDSLASGTTIPKTSLSDEIDPAKSKSEILRETDDPIQVELMARAKEESLKIGLPDPEEVFRDGLVKPGQEKELEKVLEGQDLDKEPPEIELIDGELGEISQPEETPGEMGEKVEEEPERIIHGILELKPPEADDAPFLTLTYDFGKIPHAFRLSKNYSIMEYSYYKYKPMLMKAQEFARRKMLKNALNYYRVIKSQNIPPELRKMINRNIRDITEFMEKFLMAKGG